MPTADPPAADLKAVMYIQSGRTARNRCCGHRGV